MNKLNEIKSNTKSLFIINLGTHFSEVSRFAYTSNIYLRRYSSCLSTHTSSVFFIRLVIMIITVDENNNNNIMINTFFINQNENRAYESLRSAYMAKQGQQ